MCVPAEQSNATGKQTNKKRLKENATGAASGRVYALRVRMERAGKDGAFPRKEKCMGRTGFSSVFLSLRFSSWQPLTTRPRTSFDAEDVHELRVETMDAEKKKRKI